MLFSWLPLSLQKSHNKHVISLYLTCSKFRVIRVWHNEIDLFLTSFRRLRSNAMPLTFLPQSLYKSNYKYLSLFNLLDNQFSWSWVKSAVISPKQLLFFHLIKSSVPGENYLFSLSYPSICFVIDQIRRNWSQTKNHLTIINYREHAIYFGTFVERTHTSKNTLYLISSGEYHFHVCEGTCF